MTDLERILKRTLKIIGSLVIACNVYLSVSNPKEYALKSTAQSAFIGYAFYDVQKNRNKRSLK